MKILFLVSSFYPKIGGVERHAFEVAKELTRRGHEVRVITELPPTKKHTNKNNYHSIVQSDTHGIKSEQTVKSGYLDDFEHNKIKIYRFSFGEENWFKKFRIWLSLFRNSSLIRNADIIHCHDVFFWYLPFRFLLPRKKVFTTFHGYETKFPPTPRAKLIRKISERLSFGNICVGHFIKKWYRANPDFVLYGGVKKSEITNPKEIKVNINDNSNKKINILFMGRLEEDTGVEKYLKALDVLREREQKFAFKVLGDGAIRKKIIRVGKVFGMVENPIPYIDKSDFVFSSSYLSMLECLVRGKIVIAAFTNELKKNYLEWSPFSKYVFISDDEEEIANKIRYFLNNPQKAMEFRVNAYNWAKNQTWEKVTNKYLALWRK